MLKGRHTNTEVVVFSRWSGKNYAVFASLKKVVSIGHLSIDLCKSSLLKNRSVIRLLNLLGGEDERNEECDVVEPREDAMLLLALMADGNCGDDIYCEKIRYTNLGKPIFCASKVWAFLFMPLI